MVTSQELLPDPMTLVSIATRRDEEACQRFIVDTLDYGTNLDLITDDDKNDHEVVPKEPSLLLLQQRTNEAIAFLGKSIDTVSTAPELLMFVEDVLVDCLWLCGSKSIALPWTTTAEPFHPMVQALIDITRALLLKTNKVTGHGATVSPNFSRKLQENWFPVLLEAVDLVNVTAPTTNNNNKKNTSDGNAAAISGVVATVTLGTADDLMKRLKQYNTVTNYKQQKYNLLQEESEGYSKILQYLCHNSDGNSNGSNGGNNSNKLTYLWKLVGTFELDPIRVVDLSLNVLECKLFGTNDGSKKIVHDEASVSPQMTDNIRWLLDIISECSPDKLSSLMKFKIVNTQNSTDTTDANLIKTVAFLIRENIMSLRSFMEDYFEATLEPNVETTYEIFRKKERGRVMALSRVSLSGISKEDPKQLELSKKLKLAMSKLKLVDDVDNNSGTNGNIHSDSGGNHSNRQILSLLLILIRWGDWELVKPMLSSSVWCKLSCLMPEYFGSAFLDVIEGRLKVDTSIATTPRLNNAPTDSTASPFQIQSYNSREVTATVRLVRAVRSVSDPLSLVVQSGCIASRPVLFCHLCRYLRSLLLDVIREGSDCSRSDLESIPHEVLSFLKTYLVPSLSLFPSNPAISTELWSVLKILSYEIRYKLYDDWEGCGLEKAALFGQSETKPIPNIESEMIAGKAARYTLKRLSKDNIRDMSRQLAKTTHSHPLVVYATILGQIESYDNMVEVMVEAQRFVNPLGLDVLAYCVLKRLSGTAGVVNRNRLKEDGVNVSQWLQSLETFSGEFYKERPFVEFRGLIFYLMGRLKEGNAMELGTIRTLLKVAGGYGFADYSPVASLNETQLDGRSGSVTLKRETMSFGIVEKSNPIATNRIRNVLQTDGLGVTMLILIAQARDKLIFNSAKGAFKEVKLVGNLYDTCQVVLSILLEFLTNNEGTACDGKNPNNSVTMYSKFLPSLKDLQSIYGLDMATAWFLCRPSMQAALRTNSDSLKDSSLKRFELTQTSRISYSDSFPESALTLLTPQLLEFFYMNSIYDIYCPEKLLSSEINRLEKEMDRIKALKSPLKSESDELQRLAVVSQQLGDDVECQKEHVESMLKKLNEEKANLFTTEEISREAAKAFLIYFIYPRTVQGPDDAMYSSSFAFRLHAIWTPGFSIMHYLDEMFTIVSGALFGVTEAEAANLAILLCQTLKVVNKWRHEDGPYDKEVLGKPGSFMENNEDGETSIGPVSHDDFIQLYNKWQYSLGDALIGCLKSNEYIHIRTGLVVLSRLIDVFPTGPSLGNRLLKALEPLQDESSSRPDIRASASAYGMMLLKARDEGKWLEEDEAAAKERAVKEKEAAEERKKKIEKSFKELERDNEKITAQIGTGDRPRSGLRDNHDRRAESGRQTIGRDGSSGDFARMESGEVNARNRRSGREVDRNSGDRDDDKPYNRDGGGGGRHDDKWRRDGPSSRNAKRSRPSSPIDNRESGDDDRWRRDTLSSRTTKRSRPSSPVDDRDSERSNSKRPRTDEYNNYSSSRKTRSPEPSSSRRVIRRGNTSRR